MSNLKVLPRAIKKLETGSAFDATEIGNIKGRAGGHDTLPQREIDISAFSFNKRTMKAPPTEYTRKRTGTGGTMVNSLINML